VADLIRRALAGDAVILFLLLTLSACGPRFPGLSLPGATTESMRALARGEWPAYAGTYASARYSPLDQINATNAGDLKVAWRWTSPDHAVRTANATIDPSWLHEGTPIMVDGVLYTSTSLSQVVAIDAASGRTKWVFDPGVWKLGMPTNNGWLHRGVAYWRDGEDERVIMPTGHGAMIALDAKTGRPIQTFGDKGSVDLVEGLRRPAVPRWVYGNTSPPVVVRDVIGSPVGCLRGTCGDSTSGRVGWCGPSTRCPKVARSATRPGRRTPGSRGARPTPGRC
jgi:quinoprotein glucose dehydrogenase